MESINRKSLILEEDVFFRDEIEKRMAYGGFNSISKFELFIWDLEMFLQLQNKLGDKIILKGGAATQFYIPVEFQRTSIDIDMICLATHEEVREAISKIENELSGEDDYCKFRLYKPKNPKLGLDSLDTYFETVPSICNAKELHDMRGKQEVKVEFIFTEDRYSINKINNPKLFALETVKEFNILSFENLFADKLTTLGPNTIGISDERSDEQIKQIYDVITLLTHNLEDVIKNKEIIKFNYEKVARFECKIHGLEYDINTLFKDMKVLIDRLKNIENDNEFLQRANDFQSLYLRRSVNRDKTEWAIVGFQLELLARYIFKDDMRLICYREIEEFSKKLKFDHIRGPEKGGLVREVRKVLETNFGMITGLSEGLFRKRIDRILWELLTLIDFTTVQEAFNDIEGKLGFDECFNI
jgi:hypothetical protein